MEAAITGNGAEEGVRAPPQLQKTRVSVSDGERESLWSGHHLAQQVGAPSQNPGLREHLPVDC